MKQELVKFKALTIGGCFPGLGDFEHYIAVPVDLPTQRVLIAYQDANFREACPRYKTAKAASKAVEKWNAKVDREAAKAGKP